MHIILNKVWYYKYFCLTYYHNYQELCTCEGFVDKKLVLTISTPFTVTCLKNYIFFWPKSELETNDYQQ